MEGYVRSNGNFEKSTKKKQHGSKVNYPKILSSCVSTIFGVKQRNKAATENFDIRFRNI